VNYISSPQSLTALSSEDFLPGSFTARLTLWMGFGRREKCMTFRPAYRAESKAGRRKGRIKSKGERTGVRGSATRN